MFCALYQGPAALPRRFVKQLDRVLLAQKADAPYTVAVVGGGASGVELACALKYRWVLV
jgi:NADH dehydrogenase FAD-containing subunit